MSLSGRDFLKMTSVSLGALAMRPWKRLFRLPDFPAGEILGRVTVGKVEIKARPDVGSQTLEGAVRKCCRDLAARDRWPKPNTNRQYQ